MAFFYIASSSQKNYFGNKKTQQKLGLFVFS